MPAPARSIDSLRPHAKQTAWTQLTTLTQRLKISASNIPPPWELHHEPEPTEKSPPTTVLLLPSFIIVDNVVPSNARDLIAKYINTGPTNTQPLKKTTEPEAPATENKPAAEPTEPVEPVKAGEAATDLNGPTTASAEDTASPPDLSKLTITPSHGTHTTASSTARAPLSSRPCPHKYLILLCSHKTRDARCGQSAPLLAKEFARVLRPLGLHRDLHDERPGGVGVYFINHVGGHKYSANVIIYRKGENGMFLFYLSYKKFTLFCLSFWFLLLIRFLLGLQARLCRVSGLREFGPRTAKMSSSIRCYRGRSLSPSANSEVDSIVKQEWLAGRRLIFSTSSISRL